MSRRAPSIELSVRQRAIMERLSRSRTLAKRLAERVAMILLSSSGATCASQAREMGVDAQRCRRWRSRWVEAQGRLAEAEAKSASGDELEVVIMDVLADDARSGAPSKFSAEQLAAIIGLACKAPKDVGVPVTHWSGRELARAAVKLGIVPSISPRHVARFFGGGGDSAAQVAVLAQSSNRRSRRARKPCGNGVRRVPSGARARSGGDSRRVVRREDEHPSIGARGFDKADETGSR